ncbi:uncharacterized protein METZ01_LOCUS269732, partial [marine metagenome]
MVLLPPLARCAELEAVTRQMVRPVLIRNEHNSLLQLTINAKKPFVQVQAITVELDGATELESLQFYFTGADGGFSTMKTFGDRLRSHKSIVFKGHARLMSGPNHFWLSCRAKAAANLSGKTDAGVLSIETSAGRL